MNDNQLFETAKTMFLQGSGRRDVINLFTENGISDEEASKLATDAYLAIREQRKEIVDVGIEETSKSSMGPVIGGLILLAGIIATIFTDRIWYGAIIIGLIAIFSGSRS